MIETTSYYMFYKLLSATAYGVGKKVAEFILDF